MIPATAALLFALGAGCQQPEDDLRIIPTTNGGAGGGGQGGDGTGSDGTGGADDTDAGIDAQTGDAGSDGAVIDAAAEMPAVVDAPVAMDTPPAMDVPPETSLPPLTECKTPSIDRLQHWVVESESNAMTVPTNGSILTTEGDHQVGKVSFVGGGWHIVAVWATNSQTSQVDLSGSTGFTLTYSATADFWVQLREVANYMSGEHYVATIPSTGGQVQTVFVSFGADHWSVLPRLGTPKVTYPQAITQVRGLFFIGDAANNLEFRRLRFDNFTPTCM